MKKILFVTTLFLIFTVTVIFIGCTSNKPNTQNPPAQSNNTNNTNTNTAGNTNNAAAKTFTLDELKKYDGTNGNPAYVAVNGVVYDVTKARKWNNGSHAGHVAGVDLTNQMDDSPHGVGILKENIVVGTLKK